MVSRAYAKYIRISPTKIRLLIPLIKGRSVKQALQVLRNINKRAKFPLEKVLKSAVANAKQKGYEEHGLWIKNVVANPGPMLRRYRAASFGRAVMIRRRTSHILVELDVKRAG